MLQEITINPKLQVIDYGYKKIFGLVNLVSSAHQLKIDDKEFKFEGKSYQGFSELTITGPVPDYIYYLHVEPRVLIGYTDGEVQITREEYADSLTKLDVRTKTWSDSADEYVKIWETKEDKAVYDEFAAKYTQVYSEPISEWRPIEFEVVQKQYIPEVHRKFIESSLIIDTGNLKQYKSICTFKSDPYTMMIQIATELGFEIVDNENKTAGKKLYSKWKDKDCLRFSMVNGNYIKLGELIPKYRDWIGTYEECVDKYEWQYNQIRDYFVGIDNTLTYRNVDQNEREALLKLLDDALTYYDKTEAFKYCRAHHQNLGTVLNKLKNKLLKLNG